MSDQTSGDKRPSSSKKRGKNRGRSRNGGHRNRSNRGGQHRKPKRYGGTSKAVLEERHSQRIAETERDANERFNRKELPMGFPEGLDAPNTHRFALTVSFSPSKSFSPTFIVPCYYPKIRT